MRERMLRELRMAFPDADIRMFRDGTEWFVVLKRMGHRLLYRPEMNLWNATYSAESMQGIIDTIREMQQYDVDFFYDESKEKSEDHTGRA